MRIPRLWTVVLVTLAVSSLASAAWGAGLTVASEPLYASAPAKPAFFPDKAATTTCADVLICPLGGDAGNISNGDTIKVGFNTELNQSTMCSTWTSNVARSGVAVAVSVNDNAAPSGNDSLTVTGCGGGLNYGSIDLGSTGYVSSTITYGSSTLAISDPTGTPEIILTLEGGSTGSAVASSTLNYSCHPALASSGGAACGLSKSRSATLEQF